MVIPHSDALEAAFRQSVQQHVGLVEIIRDGQVQLRLAATDGQVDADRTASQMRRFTARAADPLGQYTPGDIRDVLAPFGAECRISRGLRTQKIVEIVDVDDTQAQFATGTLTGLTATVGGSLQLSSGNTTGTRVSPALGLSAGVPVAGSRLAWREVILAPGSAIKVETSIDNGASWQVVRNLGPIPRLALNQTSVFAVLVRTTITRQFASDTTPSLDYIELRVAMDTSVDELMPMGYFSLNDTSVKDSRSGVEINLAGADLSRRVDRNGWDATFVIDEGTNVGTAIQMIVADRYPQAVFNFASTQRTTPRLFYGEQSTSAPWGQDAQALAKNIGYELFFNSAGVCTFRPVPDPDLQPSVWDFEDVINPRMLDLTNAYTDQFTYNQVIAQGEGSGNDIPVSARWFDDDPFSPTYYKGRYGTVTKKIRNSLITTIEQAQDVSNAQGLLVKGATETIQLNVVPVTFIEPSDVIGIERNRSKVHGRFAIDGMSMSLGAKDSMSIVCRRQRF